MHANSSLSSEKGLLALHALKLISHLFLYVKWYGRLMVVKWQMEGMWPVHDGYIAYMCNSRYYPPCREVSDDGNIWWMPLLPQVKYMHGPMHQRLVIRVTTTLTFALKQWSHVLALFPASHTLSSYCLYVGKAATASDGSWGFDREGTRLAYQVYILYHCLATTSPCFLMV